MEHHGTDGWQVDNCGSYTRHDGWLDVVELRVEQAKVASLQVAANGNAKAHEEKEINKHIHTHTHTHTHTHRNNNAVCVGAWYSPRALPRARV